MRRSKPKAGGFKKSATVKPGLSGGAKKTKAQPAGQQKAKKLKSGTLPQAAKSLPFKAKTGAEKTGTPKGRKKSEALLPGGARPVAVRLRKANKKTTAQQAWLTRQLNDPFVAAAKAAGYRSRAAFKLLQLDEQFRLLRGGMRVVDLGAAPGGWSQIVARVIAPQGRLVAVDILPMDALSGVEIIEGDFTQEAVQAQVRALLLAGGKQAFVDLVLSDMASPTTGHAKTDHLRIMALAEIALDFAEAMLSPGGAFVVKLFQGGAQKMLMDRLKLHFTKVKFAKPPASRKDSSEVYLVAQGFRLVAAH